MRHSKLLIAAATLTALAAFPAGVRAQVRTPDKAEIALRAAMEKESVAGDLKAAIEEYRKITVTYAKSNRGVVARALVRMGQCYEKLGSTEARKAYERAVREFGDQKEAVATAQARLEALGDPARAAGRGVVARQLWRQEGWGGWHVHDVAFDGRFAVYSKGGMASGGIYTASVDHDETRSVLPASTRNRWFLRLSRDGREIAYLSFTPYPKLSDGELHVVRIDGTGLRVFTSKELKGEVCLPGGLFDWSPDGKSLLMKTRAAGETEDRMILFSPGDGSVRPLGSGSQIGVSRFSPDGRYIASAKGKWPGELEGDILLYPVDDPGQVSLVERGGSPMWTPDGKRLLFTSRRRGPTDLWAVRVVNGRPEGTPELIREDFGGMIGISRDGEIFYSSSVETHGVYTIEFDPLTGRPLSKAKKATEGSNHAGPAWSPDGESLAYYSERSGPQLDGKDRSIVIRSTTTGKERVVTPSVPLDATLSRLQWFPDGRSLLVHPQYGRQKEKLARVDVHTGAVEWLLNGVEIRSSGNTYGPGATLSPDGKTIYHSLNEQTARQVRVVRRNLSTGEETVLCRVEGASGTEPSVSPNGQRLAVWIGVTPSGDPALFLIPASGGEPSRVQVTGGITPHRITAWSRDGKRIFFNGSSGTGANRRHDIWSVPVEGGAATPLETGANPIFSLDLHPDGRRLAFFDEQIRFELWSLKNLLGSAGAARQ